MTALKAQGKSLRAMKGFQISHVGVQTALRGQAA
jgi:hypothetical protein